MVADETEVQRLFYTNNRIGLVAKAVDFDSLEILGAVCMQKPDTYLFPKWNFLFICFGGWGRGDDHDA